jgi:hypothetical protein
MAFSRAPKSGPQYSDPLLTVLTTSSQIIILPEPSIAVFLFCLRSGLLTFSDHIEEPFPFDDEGPPTRHKSLPIPQA